MDIDAMVRVQWVPVPYQKQNSNGVSDSLDVLYMQYRVISQGSLVAPE